ncbi:hypothetical protein [Aliarcobacter lanthieri]|uniref:hypothetical protein n=1 Tax=Aliarcobacter lanthieri TaxID=1355374 RepID=UPI00047D50F3|nr:hypothetical protein [Aliarcobacter lanthieri]
MAVTELVNKISFVGSLAPLERLNSGLTTSIKTIGLTTVAYGTMAVALNSWVDKTTEAIYQTSNLSKELGVNVEAMQQWEYVAQMNGSTANALQSSMGGLAERIGEYAKFDSGEGKEVFETLGIAIKDSEGKIKSADIVMQDLAKSMQNLDVTEQRSILAKLGIDESMLQTLRLTDYQLEHLKNRVKSLGIVSEEQTNQLTKYKRSLTELQYGLNSVKTQLAIAFTPALEKASNVFNEFLINNRELIGNGLNKTVELITAFGSALSNVGGLIYDAIDNTIGFNNVLLLLGARLLYVNRAMLLNPFGLFVAGVILAIAVVDDLKVAFEGGESVIADFFASFNIDIVKTLTGAFNTLSGTLDGVLAKFLSIYESYLELVVLGEKAGNFIGFNWGTNQEELLEKITQKKKDLEKSSKDKITGAFKDGIKVDPNKPIGTTIEELQRPLNYNDTGVVHDAPNVKQIPHEKPFIPELNPNSHLPNGMVNNMSSLTTNNNTQNNNIKIDVKSDNPIIAGQTVVDSLNRQMGNANKTFNVGGR